MTRIRRAVANVLRWASWVLADVAEWLSPMPMPDVLRSALEDVDRKDPFTLDPDELKDPDFWDLN